MDTLLEELHFDMKFERGDIQLLHNHVTLHQRTAFEDYPEPERKRHLLRLWMTHDGARPIPPAFLERINGIITATTRLKAPLEAE